MKFRIIHLYGFCIGLIILLSTIFITNNPVVVSKTYKTVKNLCAKIRSKELCVVLFDQSNSGEQQDINRDYRDKEEDRMGRDYDLSPAELAPTRQGMGRRPAGSKAVRRMENVKKIVCVDPYIEYSEVSEYDFKMLDVLGCKRLDGVGL